ncbi:MAG: N-6 DNA methylase [Methanosphaera sp.]|nr:N-6 DNA methylase [Methanosphaera sp.]
MKINIRRKHKDVDIVRKIEHIDSKVDVIPFITMKYLSQKQAESEDNLSQFQNRYGFTFRDYELLTNIIAKQDDEKSSLSDIKSALNALKNSTNPDIKEIFSRMDEEEITLDVLDDILEILESEDNLQELFKQVNYLQWAIKDEDNKRIIPPTVELLSKMATTHHKPQNIYDPSSIDAQTVTELDEFNHATIYIKDEEDYYHAKQNLILHDIPLDKISISNREILIDENDAKYDTIISVPYPKQKLIKDEDIEKYSQYETKNPNTIHLLNLLSHLDDDGIIVTTTTQDLLVKKDAYKIRKYLIDNNLLDGVIEYETGYRSRDITILIINKNKKTDDFLFVKPPEMLPTFLLPAFNEDILEIQKERKIEDRLSNIINKDEIIKNEYNLNPKRYVYTLDYKQTPIEDILEKQKEQSKHIQQLDNEIEDMIRQLEKL